MMPHWLLIASAVFLTICFLVLGWAMIADAIHQKFSWTSEMITLYLGFTPIVLLIGIITLAFWLQVLGVEFPEWLARTINTIKVFVGEGKA